MTLDIAISLLAHARRDAEEVAAVLLKLAALADLLGYQKNRDDSIESAVELLACCGRSRVRSTSAFAISRLPS